MGDQICARYHNGANGKWISAKVTAVRDDGKYFIWWYDNDMDSRLKEPQDMALGVYDKPWSKVHPSRADPGSNAGKSYCKSIRERAQGQAPSGGPMTMTVDPMLTLEGFMTKLEKEKNLVSSCISKDEGERGLPEILYKRGDMERLGVLKNKLRLMLLELFDSGAVLTVESEGKPPVQLTVHFPQGPGYA